MFFLKVSPKFMKASPLSVAVPSKVEDILCTQDGRSQGETGMFLVLPGWCQVSSISFAVTVCTPVSCQQLSES